VELEEPVSKKMQNFELLDDALYQISKAVPVKTTTGLV
jgi:hypothetical protein